MPTLSHTPLFFYKPDDGAASGQEDKKLVIEIGEHHVASTVSDGSGKNIHSFAFYIIEKESSSSDIFSIIQSSIASDVFYTDVILINNRNQYVLVPEQMHKDHIAQNVLETIHGDLIDTTIHTDHIHQWEIAAIHGMNNEIESLLQHQFPQLRTIHFISPALRHAFRNMDAEIKQSLKLFFYPGYFVAEVFTADQFQLLQHFYFETPEDVLYHILNIVEKYHLDVTEVHVGVSGVIDREGDIWKEINRHFLQVSTDELGPDMDQKSNFPSHYFTPFFMVPTCV
jgi:hypothetical protein